MLMTTVNSEVDALRQHSQYERKSSLLLSRNLLHGKVRIVQKATGRVKGYMQMSGDIAYRRVTLVGIPCDLSAETLKRIIKHDSYVCYHKGCLEVRPRGFGGMLEASRSEIEWDAVPEDHLCPITKEVMKMPVHIQSCGHIFDESAIREKLENGENCPECGKKLAGQLTPDFRFKGIIDNWVPNQKEAILPFRLRKNKKKLDYENRKRLIDAAKLLIKEECYKDAVESYEDALELTDKTEDYVAYVELLEKVKSPKLVKAYIYLARVYKSEAEKEKCEELQRKVVENYENALDLMQGVEAFKVERVNYLEEFAEYLKEIKREREAIQQYEILLNMAIEEEVQIVAARCYNTLIKEEATPGKYHLDYFRFLINGGEVDKALEMEKKIRECGQGDQQYEELLKIAREKNVRIVAEQCYHTLIELEPVSGKYHLDYFRFLIDGGEVDKALEMQREFQAFWEGNVARSKKERQAKSQEARDTLKTVKSNADDWLRKKKELKDVLVGNIQESLRTLDLNGCSMEEVNKALKKLDALFWRRMLHLVEKDLDETASSRAKEDRLKKVNFSEAEVGIVAIERLLKHNGGIEKLYLRNNKQLREDSLASIFRYGHNLRYVDFEGCKGLTDEVVRTKVFSEARGSKLVVKLPSGDKLTVKRKNVVESDKTENWITRANAEVLQDANSLKKLGHMLLGMNRFCQAIKYYVKALEILASQDANNKESSWTMNKLSDRFFQLGDHGSAIKIQSKVLETLDPDSQDVHDTLRRLQSFRDRGKAEKIPTRPQSKPVSSEEMYHLQNDSLANIVNPRKFAPSLRSKTDNTEEAPFLDIDVPGDGACLFHAIALGLQLNENAKLSSRDLRNAAASHLEHNRELHTESIKAQITTLFYQNRELPHDDPRKNQFPGIPGAFKTKLINAVQKGLEAEQNYANSAEGVNDYINHMFDLTAWGGEIELGVLAELLQLQFLIYNGKEAIKPHHPFIGSPKAPKVHLLFDGDHYGLRIPKASSDFEDVPKKASSGVDPSEESCCEFSRTDYNC